MPELSRIERPSVRVTRTLLPAVEKRMAELFDTRFNADDVPLTRDALVAAMADCDVLVPTVTDSIDASIIAAAPPRLKLIASYGAGVNHIDLAAAKAKGIMVTNTPGVFTDDTADLTMALILNVPRRLGEGHRAMRNGEWSGWSPTGMLGHRIGGKTLGIIGLGRIGEAVAMRAKAFGMNIIYNKRSRLPASVEDELGVTFEPDLDRLVARSDIITLHCPLTADTDKIINADRIAHMKPNAYVINSSRGELIDEDALIEALQSGRIAGAGLDVYTHEPAVDSRFLSIPNAVLLPHLGSATYEGREASGERVITNIRVWADGHRPPDQVLEGWQ
ncbi:MAG: D-glycerate dehydrogenase [Sphingomonadales bacterium 35-56-22]|jgi:glyoxylate reductase|uniref:2-hydroxyacid dehydrogenase n=1 Tax=Sphingorhabdus sp. TaxID=1902408 RepID=UPI000BC858DB|nr:D-glycerate dehydrogenase [Sphingorhabdus sp.]OYY15365.1 MAG: D-glycerate dehydrogenase [Sphingomonadales bacterium 35-56-22]OYY97144.1 MAG: D-glycerate dehydrogenase [Sphingomonadales bacterium 28-56-43]OYZ60272.1 MAG: D-glycerate dehydrogenase [Sphingomonadales bacterium 24-56-14]OZA82863.1 MAG: D-glycerate dehydrogenase [Sphingomonadales bacterium 39-57-19]HQS13106.1 D-glycerate dehydrogenase [Sphingorhabdus sp.]